MKKIIIVLSLIFSFSFAQSYCTGDQISISDQDIVHVVGAGVEGYPTGSEFKLSDFNGDLNGGDYAIILIDMSTSW